MKFILMGAGVCVALASLSACDRKTEMPATSATPATIPTTATPSKPAATSPTAGIVPYNEEKATASGATGPAQASTAIGGMVGNQEKGGAATSSAPEPSGGDGSVSKPAVKPK
jgi:hypothetical protein